MENKSKALEYLNIARSSFYYNSILDSKDESLRQRIEEVLDKHPSYGHKRIALELHMNRKPIRRVMKKFGIKPRRGHKKPWKRAVGEESASSPNLLVALIPLFKHHVWVTDFTYLWWRGRWVYVCTIIDLWSREVLGISIKTNHSAMLVTEALLNALAGNPAPLFTHSDQGSEYKSKLFRRVLSDFKITQSMSKKGSPWQNGYQESFYGKWKVDIGDVNRFKTLGELTAEIYKSIYYYNNERIHTALGMTPREFARQNEIRYNTKQEILVV
jgi:putative transposase